ncbi:Uma2 family endonuclease [Planctomicrobium sp. SH664]|uniref:Uma2 family endonuclease n=1 Tax=Planctomicrobium sp. SH664 TaxID=3448125 RepID=UPI003F5C55D3
MISIIAELFRGVLPSGSSIRQQAAVTFSQSEPEPDISIVRGEHRDDLSRHPAGEDIFLLIEVADSSLRKDRRKAAIYASAGVPAYWIVNLEQRQIEGFQRPEPEQREFLGSKIYRSGESVEALCPESR